MFGRRPRPAVNTRFQYLFRPNSKVDWICLGIVFAIPVRIYFWIKGQ